MKNNLLLMVFLMSGLFLFGQKGNFKLTTEGFRASDNKEASYIVMEYPGIPANELYKRALVFFHSKFNSPKDVLSTIDNEAITVNAICENCIHRNNYHVFDMNFTVNILFKEGKIRVDAPSFILTTNSGHKQTLHLNYSGVSMDGSDLGIYGKEGKVKSDDAINDLEKYFNSFSESLKKGIESSNGNSSW